MPPRKVRAALAAFLLLATISIRPTQAGDLFNYRETDGIDFGPSDWNEVSCNDVNQCVSYIPYRPVFLSFVTVQTNISLTINSHFTARLAQHF
jgi:hypothetical protein